MLTLPDDSTKYNLNQDQKIAADKFLEFLFSEEKEFIISGPAGVGKTFLMNYIVDTTMSRYKEMCKLIGLPIEYNEVIMTATTNKAADVLGKATNRETSTVHSFFNLVVRPDYKTGKSTLRQTGKWMVHNGKIIFVDESSMIDNDLWRMLHDGTMNCKLVYVGDRYQLAPVQEDLSPIYKHTTPMVELLQPMRNANQPALMNICAQLRHTVATGEFKPIQIVPGVIDLLDGQQMQTEIANHFTQQTHDVRILAYTNKRVVEYNDHIRGMRNLPTTFQAGEFLVNNAVYHHSKGQIYIETEVEVLTNHGPDRVMVDEEHQVYLDVDRLTIQDQWGRIISRVPYPTNREHYAELVKYYTRAKQFKKMYDLRDYFADFRPRDAATVYKSQGSTYDTAFVDLGNISTCHNPSQVARMLYVAFSRARNRVFLYGDLATKYGGLIL